MHGSRLATPTCRRSWRWAHGAGQALVLAGMLLLLLLLLLHAQ
jgi:hypothetical protein